MHDLIIIGGGPAGMTAAVYAARKKLDQALIAPQIGGQTIWASEVENYLGYRFISGYDLVQKFEHHVRDFGVQVEDEAVQRLSIDGRAFIIETDHGNRYEARIVIIASGRSARSLGAVGEDEYKGRGVAYCATCDAPLFQDEDVAVVGTGNAGLDAAIQLCQFASHVYIIESQDHMTGDMELQDRVRDDGKVTFLFRTQVIEIHGNQFVNSIRVKSLDTGEERDIAVAGIFVQIGATPNTGFLPPEIRLNKHSEIEVDCACRTSVPGIFAAGDVTSIPGKQIVIAAGEGAKALLSAYDYLIHHYAKRAVAAGTSD